MREIPQGTSHPRLRSHILASWRPLAIGLALGIVGLVFSLIQPFWAGDLIERVQQSLSISKQLTVVVCLSVLGAITVGVQQLILGALSERSTSNWRHWFLGAFFHLPLLGRQSRSPGWYTSRLVTDPPLVGRFVGTILRAIASKRSNARCLTHCTNLHRPDLSTSARGVRGPITWSCTPVSTPSRKQTSCDPRTKQHNVGDDGRLSFGS